MKWTPQTGDTQVIFIEKRDSFIDWCIGVAKTAVDKRLSKRGEPSQLPPLEMPRKRNAA